MKTVDVAVGVIKRGTHIFISKRPDTLHQGGKWEFPGGKREANETMEQALARELMEEIGIKVVSQIPLMCIEHDYGDKRVVLDVRVIEGFEGEPKGMEGQQTCWVAMADLNQYDFPAANYAIIEQLQRHYCPD